MHVSLAKIHTKNRAQQGRVHCSRSVTTFMLLTVPTSPIWQVELYASEHTCSHIYICYRIYPYECLLWWRHSCDGGIRKRVNHYFFSRTIFVPLSYFTFISPVQEISALIRGPPVTTVSLTISTVRKIWKFSLPLHDRAAQMCTIKLWMNWMQESAHFPAVFCSRKRWLLLTTCSLPWDSIQRQWS